MMEYQTNSSSADDEFIVSFENCTLPPELFHHRDHIRLSWLYLRRCEPIEALGKLSESIKRFATFHGKADRYHETITWAYFFLIRERVERIGFEQSWEEFITHNEDLFDWKDNILARYYKEGTLSEDVARRTFVLPDRPSESIAPA
jgi:hypothetical protein